MGKNYFLSYNEITRDYFLDTGLFDRNRNNLGKKLDSELICKKLKELMPQNRESILYVENSLFEQTNICLNAFFDKTRVRIKYVEDLRNIKRKA